MQFLNCLSNHTCQNRFPSRCLANTVTILTATELHEVTPLLDLGDVALRNSIIFIKRDPQVALCQMASAFSEQLSQKARERDVPVKLGCPQLLLEESELLSSSCSLTYEDSSEYPWGSP